jgi:hypothetical protein
METGVRLHGEEIILVERKAHVDRTKGGPDKSVLSTSSLPLLYFSFFKATWKVLNKIV